jgi:hypothetical protein
MDHSQTLGVNQTTTSHTATPRGPWGQALRSPLLLGLLVLLGLQILAAIGLSLVGRGALTPAALDSALLDFAPQSVTAIRIDGGSEGPVTLAKADRGWVIADLADFPADGTKVDQLLEKLAVLKRPLPIATSPEAQRRHKVADEGFERRVTLEAGDRPVATLILGDSPGFRRTFARPAGESVVYDLDLPLFDVSNRRDDWLARDSLHVGQETIERVSSADWTLIKAEGAWKLEGSDQVPDEQVVNGLLSRLANLSYRGVLGGQDKPEYNLASPALEITLGLTGGTERNYRIAQAKDSEDWVLKASDRPWYFKLAEFDLEGLKDLSRDKLLGAAPSAPEAGASDAAPTAAVESSEAPVAAGGEDTQASSGPAEQASGTTEATEPEPTSEEGPEAPSRPE